ncbi:hypothetical protein KEM55_001873 [Ascosphaera atra]|nr:hypothetical protein KEM55_001873 [Ascosphaera atra]
MFWRFGGYSSVSAIDTLLDKPDVTLEEILDESELMSELKQNNSKLIEYLREDDVLKRLLEYVTSPSLLKNETFEEEETSGEDDKKEGQDGRADAGKDQEGATRDTDEDARRDAREEEALKQQDREDLEAAEKSRLRYAYIACEILSSSTWSIIETLLHHEEYLRRFWEFLSQPAPLDALQSGYFTKVNETLLESKTAEMLAFFRSIDGIVERMLLHVDNPMIMDLLLKIISLERAEGGLGIVEWIKSQNLIPTLLSFLSTDHPFSVQTSAGDFLKAIIAISANAAQNDPTIIGPNSLTRQLVSESCVSSLITSMLKGGNPLTVGVGIVIEVIRKNNSDYDPEFVEGPNSLPSVNDPIYLGTLLRLFARHVPAFMHLILSKDTALNDSGRYAVVPRKTLSSAAHTPVEALGFDRFKTCELMAELLHCSNMGLLNEAGSEEYIRRRDAERERLVRDGSAAVWRESGADVDTELELNESDLEHGGIGAENARTRTEGMYLYDGQSRSSSAEFLEGLSGADHGASTPSEVVRGLEESAARSHGNEVTESGEDDDDDGFEDVSTIMREEAEKNARDGRRDADADADADAPLPAINSGQLELEEFVDEPLTPPPGQTGHQHQHAGKHGAQSYLCKQSHGQPPYDAGHEAEAGSAAHEQEQEQGEKSTAEQDASEDPTDQLSSQLASMDIASDDDDREKQQQPRRDSQVPERSTTPPETPVPAHAVLATSAASTPTVSTPVTTTPPPIAGGVKEQEKEEAKPAESSAGADVSGQQKADVSEQEQESMLDVVDYQKYDDSFIQVDIDGKPVIGDYLKIQFVENKVVPTILSFFFRFPWNNFLHNVVFDVIQQVLSGPMDRGFNRTLTIDVFSTGRVTHQIVAGQKRSDEAQRNKNMRLGYMGHLTLIAEEVIKFSERHPPDALGAEIMHAVTDADWADYVENTLSDTRERDNAILGGVRPDFSLGNRHS